MKRQQSKRKLFDAADRQAEKKPEMCMWKTADEVENAEREVN